MQRLLGIALAVMMLLSLAACKEEKQDQTESVETAAISESAAKTDAPTDEQTKGNHEVISLNFINTFDRNPSIEEQTVYEKDGLTITAKSLKYDTVHGPQIMLAAKNDSENELRIQNAYTTVNGFMMKPELDIKAPARKKVESPMSLPYLNLAMADIHSLYDVTFSLRILDSKTFSVIDTTDTVSLRLQNTAAEHPAFSTKGQTAFDSKGVKVILQGIKQDTLFESRYVLMVYIENNTKQTVCVKNDSLSVNGYDITVSMNTVVLPGVKAVDKIEIFDQDLEEYGITTIDAVNVSFEVYDYEEWKSIAKSDVIPVEVPTELLTEATETQSTENG